eukprot:589303-Pelagomonas_calceolata.AAC.1
MATSLSQPDRNCPFTDYGKGDALAHEPLLIRRAVNPLHRKATDLKVLVKIWRVTGLSLLVKLKISGKVEVIAALK